MPKIADDFEAIRIQRDRIHFEELAAQNGWVVGDISYSEKCNHPFEDVGCSLNFTFADGGFVVPRDVVAEIHTGAVISAKEHQELIGAIIRSGR